MRKALLPTIVLLLLVLPLWMAGTVDADAGASAPLILSAREVGDRLVIRGSDLVGAERAAPIVTLSGRVLRVEPGFSGHELRAALPEIEAGSYLLTVAWSRQAPQAGVLAVTLAGPERSARSRGRSHSAVEIHACANSRHTRIVGDASECKRNEQALVLTGSVAGPPEDVGSDPDDEDDSDAEEVPEDDEDGEDDEQDDGRDDDTDSDDDSDSEDDSDSDSDGNGQGKNKKKDKGNGGGG